MHINNGTLGIVEVVGSRSEGVECEVSVVATTPAPVEMKIPLIVIPIANKSVATTRS